LTSDVAENQILLFACHVLLSSHGVTGAFGSVAVALGHFDELLRGSGVRLQPPSEVMLRQTASEAEPLYGRALRLAQMIIGSRGVKLLPGGTEVSLASLLVDMEDVFERYVRRVLSVGLADCTVLNGNEEGAKPLYDDRSAPPVNPDAVVRRSGHGDLIVEVKYKALETRSDIEQVLTYSMSYRAPAVVLVLPAQAATDKGLENVGTVNGVRVCRYRFDLSAHDLAVEEHLFVTAVAALVAAG
jgi:5-methylcytosine-specific restriction enzyme subunit McrC